MHFRAKVFLVLGALSGALSTVMAAVIAHAPLAQAAMQPMLAGALAQHQFHSVGLLAAGLVLQRSPRSTSVWAAGWMLVAGIVLFSLNIYARGLGGFDQLRTLVPWGGTLAIAGWLCLALGIARLPAPKDD